MAKRHTWQVAMQVAAGRALHYADQLRQKGKRVTISNPNASYAVHATIQPLQPGTSSRPAPG